MTDDGKRDQMGRFLKGVSGNPGGPNFRDGKLRKVRRALEALDKDAVTALTALMQDGDPKVVAKAVEIWARYRLPVPKAVAADANATVNGAAPQLSEEAARAIASWRGIQ